MFNNSNTPLVEIKIGTSQKLQQMTWLPTLTIERFPLPQYRYGCLSRIKPVHVYDLLFEQISNHMISKNDIFQSWGNSHLFLSSNVIGEINSWTDAEANDVIRPSIFLGNNHLPSSLFKTFWFLKKVGASLSSMTLINSGPISSPMIFETMTIGYLSVILKIKIKCRVSWTM